MFKEIIMAQKDSYLKFTNKYAVILSGYRVIWFIILSVLLGYILILLILSIPILWIQIVLGCLFAFFYIILFYGIFRAIRSKQKDRKN